MAQTTKEYVRGLKVRYTKQLIDLKVFRSLNKDFISKEELLSIDVKINLLENIIKDLEII